MVDRRFLLFSSLTAALALTPNPTEASEPMNHLVLLGDSTFDNRAYVPPRCEVIALLKRTLPAGCQASLLAVDGSLIADVEQQIASLPRDATHLLISVGGNDGLQHAALLSRPVASVAEALAHLDDMRVRFEDGYRRMLDKVCRYGLPVAICSIYRPRFDDTALQLASQAALPLLNDAITREAFARGLDLLDFRLLFDDPADFSHTIEPSAQGGAKMARAIVGMLVGENSMVRRSQVFVR
jgi:hypothetical protein